MGRCWGEPTQSPGCGPGWKLSWSAQVSTREPSSGEDKGQLSCYGGQQGGGSSPTSSRVGASSPMPTPVLWWGKELSLLGSCQRVGPLPRTTDPDMVLNHSPGPDITMALGGSTDHSDWYGPGCSWPLDTSMVTGGIPDPGIHMGFGGNMGHRDHHRP